MAYETIIVTPTTPRIGAEVTGVDLTRPLSNHQVAELAAALAERQVLFFRDQPLDLDSHQTLGRHFGELHVHPNVPGPAGYPAVLPIHTDAKSRRIAGEDWHSDVSCDEEPPLGSILHLHTVPPVGGDTLFASMFAAYEALSPRMKSYLEGLTATHAGEHVYRSHNERDSVAENRRVYPRAIHPVIRTHPVTKRQALFVNATFTTRINELPAEESRAVLAFLYEHAARPEFQVRFRWRPNSVAFWDNRSAQHMALWDYFPETRSGHRVTIKGDRPV